MAWFRERADIGLLEKLIEEQCKDRMIVCEDGFKATTPTIQDLKKIAESLQKPYEITETDQSSIIISN